MFQALNCSNVRIWFHLIFTTTIGCKYYSIYLGNEELKFIPLVKVIVLVHLEVTISTQIFFLQVYLQPVYLRPFVLFTNISSSLSSEHEAE